MMYLFRLIYISIFLLAFSGRPAPVAPKLIKHINGPALPAYLPDADDDKAIIPWITERKLAWNDFESTPEKNTDAVASTSTSLGISYKVLDNQLTYHISCNFSKDKSWVLLKTDYILAHEQGHFDITEVFARKLNKELSEYQFNPESFKQDISNIYQSVVDEKESYQEAYDGETDHSRHKKIQMEWLDKIQQMLTETEPYANYP